MNNRLKKGIEKGLRISAPNSFVIIFIFIVVATVLTHIIPAGSYERTIGENGEEIVAADSFQYIEQTPVSVGSMFTSIGEAFKNSADIIFCILFAFCFVGVLIEGGVFDAIFGWVISKLKNKTKLLLPIIMLTFGLMGSVAGLAEETFGMFPVCISLAIAMGYDRIVGSSIVYLAVFTGFASATFNPYTIGVAQAIAGVPMYSGLGFRIFSFIVFMGILIIYVMRYAAKVKAHPEKGLLYDIEKPAPMKTEELHGIINPRQKLNILLFAVVMFSIVFGALRFGWYIGEILAIFIAAYIIAGLINGWGPNKMGEKLVEIGGGTLFSMLIIGFSNTVSLIMEKGNITDTVVHAMAELLRGTSGYLSAVMMLVIQNILNFFIPSGPGQAAVSMPIMSSFSDVTGLSRQLAVLAFQYGDGFSNIFWPTMVCMMCGIIKVPIGKWYKFVTPLFLLMFAAQVVLICLAVMIGYH